MRCLEKDRNRRYGSPQEVAQDIERYRRDEPVLAGPPSASLPHEEVHSPQPDRRGDRGATVVVLVAFAATMAVQSKRIATQRDRANHEAEVSTRVSEFLANMLGDVDPQRMGESLVADIRTRIESAHAESVPDVTDAGVQDGDAGRTQRALDDFDLAMEGVDPTNVALELLDTEILERAAQTIDEELTDEPLIAARLRHTIGKTYESLGMFQQAIPHVEASLEALKLEAGPEDPLTLAAMRDLAFLQQNYGQKGKSEELFRDLYEAHVRVFGPAAPQTLHTMHDLAFVLHRFQQKHPEGEELLREALRRSRDEYGDAHAETLRCAYQLGGYLNGRGRGEEALPLYEEVLAGYTVLYGEDDEKTLGVAASLADMRWSTGGRDESLALRERILATQRRTLGDRHNTTLLSMSNLGSLYMWAGRMDDALPKLEEAWSIAPGALGEDAHTTLWCELVLGEVYLELERFEEAEPLLVDVYPRIRRVFGDEFVGISNILNDLARLYLRTGRRSEARRYVQELHAREIRAADKEGADAAAKLSCARYLLYCEMEDMRKPHLALRMALTANESQSYANWSSLQVLADAQHQCQQDDDAVATLQKALALGDEISDEDRQALGKKLAEYQEAASPTLPAPSTGSKLDKECAVPQFSGQ